MSITQEPKWLLLIFSLPAKQASRRVQVWRKLQRLGALPLRTSGHVLPYTPANHEGLEWLAAAIRTYRGHASVAQVQAFDDLPPEELKRLFSAARSHDYQKLIREVRRAPRQVRKRGLHKKPLSPEIRLARLRQRFRELTAIDFFHSPLQTHVENLLARAEAGARQSKAAPVPPRRREEYTNRVWVTRPRPGIDRVASAWLIRRFIDPGARFVFGAGAAAEPPAVPFDMFQEGGFGHRGEDCTFETLRTEFAISDPRAGTLAEIVHDADLDDGKFSRTEGLGLDRALIGWAQLGITDEELLRRGMEMVEGLYQALP